MSSQQLVIFKLNEESFGIDIAQVDRIISPIEIFKVPNTPEYVEGLINLRGKVYSVFNLRRRFHLPEKEFDENTKIIIVKQDTSSVGFIVDEVNEIVTFDESDLESAPQVITQLNKKFLSGIAKKSEKIVMILDITQVLSFTE